MEPGRHYSILVTGDSISRGIIYDEGKGRYSVSDRGYVALVQRKLRGAIYNVARFGNTVVRGVGRLGKEIERDRPDAVLFEYGGNDCDFAWGEVAASPESLHLPATELPLFEETLERALRELKGEGIVPLLMSLPPLNADDYLAWVSGADPETEGKILKWLGSVSKIYWWQERYSSSIVRLAERTSTPWIDVRGAFLSRPDFRGLLCRDGIHPNEAGHELIAETVVDYVSANFSHLLVEPSEAVLA